MNAADDVAAMAQHMLQVDDRGSHVASPLAAWVLRELIDTADTASARTGASSVDTVRGSEHPAVRLRVAAWVSQFAAGSIRLDGAARGTTEELGPDQHLLDAWTARATDNTYSQFPLDLADDPLAILARPEAAAHGQTIIAAVAAATDSRWMQAPAVARAGDLSWIWAVDSVLRQRDSCGLAWDQFLGIVGVTVGVATSGMFCISVIAEPDVAPLRVLAAAHRIGRRVSAGEQVYLLCPPVQESSWWSAAEPFDADVDPFGRPVNTALTPAWMVHADHDMYHSGLDYHGAFKMRLCDRLDMPDNDFRSRQATVARYDAVGLTARSVTAVRSAPVLFPDILSASLMISETEAVEPPPADPTSVTISYDHPFAAVAYSVSEHPGSPWNSMALWSAWITEAMEP